MEGFVFIKLDENAYSSLIWPNLIKKNLQGFVFKNNKLGDLGFHSVVYLISPNLIKNPLKVFFKDGSGRTASAVGRHMADRYGFTEKLRELRLGNVSAFVRLYPQDFQIPQSP